MNEIWANRLVAGTKTWPDVPSHRKDGVKAVLQGRVETKALTAEKYKAITGEELPAAAAGVNE